jgi:hypothetical protein
LNVLKRRDLSCREISGVKFEGNGYRFTKAIAGFTINSEIIDIAASIEPGWISG